METGTSVTKATNMHKALAVCLGCVLSELVISFSRRPREVSGVGSFIFQVVGARRSACKGTAEAT